MTQVKRLLQSVNPLFFVTIILVTISPARGITTNSTTDKINVSHGIATEDIFRTARLNEILIKMLIELREHYTLSKNEYNATKRSFDAVKCTIKFIRTNYERKISLDETAKNAFMDKYTLSREFKKLTGMTIVQYINSYRCKKAAEYITSGTSVSESARMCGFTNMSFFTKTFKLYMHKKPSEYKDK